MADGRSSGGAVRGLRGNPAQQLAGGVVVLLLAIVLFAGSRLVAATQNHSYDKGATPSATYHLTVGKTYQLSSPTGDADLKSAGVLDNLVCVTTNSAGVQTPLTSVATLDDERDLRMFATFQAAATGDFAVTCTGISRVFVDDADDSAFDWAALLMLLAIAAAVVGVIGIASGVYNREPAEPVDVDA